MNIEEIVARLRQTESRSKRKLLDEAADAIEELAKTSIVKRIPCEVDPRKEYVELDGIRLVCEEGQIVGWYRPGDGLANPVVLNMDNEKRLIDANKLIDFIDVGHLRHPGELCYSEVDVANLLLHAPTINAVEVTRCWECKHLMFSDCYGECSKGYLGIVSPNDFCSYGRRKGGAENA